ncbi:hypothetical protein [Mucilaginibacter paludis]|uniref:Uncharacterized protein n=1 Tax=Mucilaginibacter paludis DSM 18603 TaxID=714943 RepID=H1YAF5_9SPHI|nr:hypothetical protein [Mucilaginibacter paludis]EHQ26998.1 hypothetical protein Mucpa_2889 [Mucilaginibacter paludis DSM 18603]
MKTIKLTNLRKAIIREIKAINFKKILGGAWLERFIRDIHPEIADVSVRSR